MDSKLKEIREYQQKLFNLVKKIKYKRYFYDTIANDKDRLIGIIGARGVGKTTFLLQYLLSLDIEFSKKLYLSADTINISSLFDVANEFSKEDGKVLVIDEIHKYRNFEIELKKIYDFLDLKVLFSGSSALEIDNSKADLSRRAMMYDVKGLSFREFLELNQNITLPKYTFEELINNHVDIAYELLDKFNLKLNFREYIQHGYYPFYFVNKENYLIKLNETVNTVIEVDIPSIFPVEYQVVTKLKKLVRLLCESYPYVPNIKELLSKMDMANSDYQRLYKYLFYLDRAKILNTILPKYRGDSIFVKPEKIYLNNTNLHYAYCQKREIGTIRELFFVSMLRDYGLEISKKGDFLVKEILFEIGGKNKTSKQIKDIPNSFIVADDLEIGNKRTIPLWLFGFLY